MSKPKFVIEYSVDADEFKHYVGRCPKSQKEFDLFCHYYKNGLDAQIDWDVIGKCAADEIKKGN